jgi:hypothetical protein
MQKAFREFLKGFFDALSKKAHLSEPNRWLIWA